MDKFWKWYERNYTLNAGIAAFLFLIQIVHLIWLLGEVIWFKLTGTSLFVFTGVWKSIIVLVDYTEIPAIITTSFVYINDIRTKSNVGKAWLFLFFINSQWLHLFWITDEFVVDAFYGAGTILPVWLAWIAILIDYLELPVVYETIKKFIQSVKEKRVEDFLVNDLKEM